MNRVTIRVPKPQLEDVENLVERGTYPNRSEAIRTAIRDLLEKHERPRPRLRADGGSHANRIIEQLRRAEEHEDLPADARERFRRRREELEDGGPT